MAIGGAALKLFQTFLYALEFCAAAVILGIYSYFLATLADRDLTIYTWVKAVEGIAGAAVLYTIFAVLLTCFLGGKSLFAFIAIVLDVLFTGGFVAIAVLTREAVNKCSGFVRTPLGDGEAGEKQGFDDANGNNQYTYAVSLGTACRLNKACFAVAVIGAALFLLSALVQVFLARHHKKEKRFGPSPANGYTSGRRKGFFGRRKNRKSTLHDPEVAAGAGTLATGPHHDVRPSHDTANTLVGNNAYDPNKAAVGGYHTAPVGTAVPATHTTHTTHTTHPTTATNY